MSWFKKEEKCRTPGCNNEWLPNSLYCFACKRIEELEGKIEELEGKMGRLIKASSEQDEKICEKCACYFQRYENCSIAERAQTDASTYWGYSPPVWRPHQNKTYCKGCRPAYDEIEIFSHTTKIYYKNTSAQRIEVDEKGRPIKEKKKK